MEPLNFDWWKIRHAAGENNTEKTALLTQIQDTQSKLERLEQQHGASTQPRVFNHFKDRIDYWTTQANNDSDVAKSENARNIVLALKRLKSLLKQYRSPRPELKSLK